MNCYPLIKPPSSMVTCQWSIKLTVKDVISEQNPPQRESMLIQMPSCKLINNIC